MQLLFDERHSVMEDGLFYERYPQLAQKRSIIASVFGGGVGSTVKARMVEHGTSGGGSVNSHTVHQ